MPPSHPFSIRLPKAFAAALLAVFTLILCSCGHRPAGLMEGGVITKVKTTKLEHGARLPTADASIAFERRHLNYGAITTTEQRARSGNYYAVFWSADRAGPVTVRLEYRQQNSRDRLRRLDLQVANPAKSNVTHFNVTGEAQKLGGPVTAWRASILQGGKVIATYESFLWK